MILPLLIFLAPLAYSPGPGNLFFAAAAARLGLRATLLALAGYHIATLIITLAIGMGGFAALAQRPIAFEIIKTTGAAYVLWLGGFFAPLRLRGTNRNQMSGSPTGFGCCCSTPKLM